MKALLLALEKLSQTLTVRINSNHESPLILSWVSPGFSQLELGQSGRKNVKGVVQQLVTYSKWRQES